MVKRGCVYYPIIGKLCIMMENRVRSSKFFTIKNNELAVKNNPDFKYYLLKNEEMVKTCDECKYQNDCKLENYIGGRDEQKRTY
ncbi:hypothetical protein [Deferribacter abyssi]|uniref:hypothetical protein n=1 Tax=Deferribacter abyssi TaxID=213806 RepID=UPI003C2935D5